MSERMEQKWAKMADDIITAVEAYERTGKWVRPWKTMQHRNMFTGTVYKGVNTFLLMMTPYECPMWGTFNQWSKAGHRIKKGESGEIVWSNPYHRNKDEDGNVSVTYGRSYPIYIFNGEQIDGFEWSPDTMKVELNPEIHDALTAKNPTIVSDDKNSAYYAPARDVINMPPQDQFLSAESYFSVLAHELVHWTGAASRLNRVSVTDYKNNRPFEELIAEIGSAILGTELGFSTDIRENHFEYIKSWIRLLRDEKNALREATSEALTAVRFLR